MPGPPASSATWLHVPGITTLGERSPTHHHTPTSVSRRRFPDLMSARPVFSLPRVRRVPLRTFSLFALQSDLDIAVPPRVFSLPGGTPGAFL